MRPKSRNPELRVGISGWRYPPWRGSFYPKGLAQKLELSFASRQLNSIEINGSFYSLQRPSLYRRWYEDTPEDFVFSVKGSRFITHLKQLKDIDTALSNFFASGILALKEKLGPILWQFPPRFKYQPQKMKEFFKLLPRTGKQAVELARRHDRRLKERAFLKTEKDTRIRYAVEIRHSSFENPEFIELLRQENIALVFADTAGKWPYLEEVTADFIYLRLHGDKQIYVSGYDDQALNWWADRIQKWQTGRQPKDAVRITRSSKISPVQRDAYIYFDNDVKVRAPFDAISLHRKLTEFFPKTKQISSQPERQVR